jgi:hypothetical protein
MRDGVQVNHNRLIKKNVLPSELMLLKSGEGFISFAGFAPAKFRFSDCYFRKIAKPYEENTDLFKLFQQEVEQGEKRRKEIEAKLLQKSNKNKDSKDNNKTKTASYSKKIPSFTEIEKIEEKILEVDKIEKKAEGKSEKTDFSISESI